MQAVISSKLVGISDNYFFVFFGCLIFLVYLCASMKKYKLIYFLIK